MNLNKRPPKRSFWSVKNTILTIILRRSAAFCFSGDMCGRKTPYKRKSLFGDFQGHVGGIGGSGAQSENLFSANGIPAKRVRSFVL